MPGKIYRCFCSVHARDTYTLGSLFAESLLLWGLILDTYNGTKILRKAPKAAAEVPSRLAKAPHDTFFFIGHGHCGVN